MSSLFSAHRLAAVAAFLTSLAAGLGGIVHVFPATWANAVLAVAAVLGVVATSITFMLGAQQSEKNTTALKIAQIHNPTPPASPAVPAISSGGESTTNPTPAGSTVVVDSPNP